MKTKMSNDEQRKLAAQVNLERIVKAKEVLEAKIEAARVALANGSKDWGHVGDLAHFAEKLEQAAGLDSNS